MCLVRSESVVDRRSSEVIAAIADALDDAADRAAEEGRSGLAERHRLAAMEVRLEE